MSSNKPKQYLYRLPEDVEERWIDMQVKAVRLGTNMKEVISYLLLEWVDEGDN
jgi:hypothetical protein